MNPRAAKLLDAAKKADPPEREPLIFEGAAGLKDAAKYIDVAAKEALLAEALLALKVALLQAAAPFQLASCRQLGEYRPTVHFPVPKGTVKGTEGTVAVTFLDKYFKIRTKAEEALLAVLGKKDYPRYFEKAFGIKIKKSISDDPAKLSKAINLLGKALGRAKFEEIFEVDHSLEPTTAFTEARPTLAKELLAQLEDAGVRQSVTVSIV